MTPSPPPNWLLPRGVNRGLWDYLHDEDRARNYDQSLSDSALFRIDLEFVRKHCPGPATMLDLGCGTGRLLLDLASRGWKGIGIDLSPAMLGVAREKAKRENASVEFLRGNLADLDFLRDAIADHAACLFSTIGMMLGDGVRRDFLRHVFRMLKPGGCFIVHVHNRWWHLRDRPGRRWLLNSMIHRLRGHSQRQDRVMPSHQGQAGLTLHLFTRGEILGELREAGFEILDACPLGVGPEGWLRLPWFMSTWRAYGFLVASAKPHGENRGRPKQHT